MIESHTPIAPKVINIEVTASRVHIGKSAVAALVFDLLRRQFGPERVTLYDAEQSYVSLGTVSPNDRAIAFSNRVLKDVQFNVIDANRPIVDPKTLTDNAFRDVRIVREPEDYFVITFEPGAGVKHYLHEVRVEDDDSIYRWVKDRSLATHYTGVDVHDLVDTTQILSGGNGTRDPHPSVLELVKVSGGYGILGQMRIERISQETYDMIPVVLKAIADVG